MRAAFSPARLWHSAHLQFIQFSVKCQQTVHFLLNIRHLCIDRTAETFFRKLFDSILQIAEFLVELLRAFALPVTVDFGRVAVTVDKEGEPAVLCDAESPAVFLDDQFPEVVVYGADISASLIAFRRCSTVSRISLSQTFLPSLDEREKMK